MSDPILVHLFFSGLIAFVPTPVGGSSVEELTVLLLDTTAYKPPPGGCAAPHTPTIRFWQDADACKAQANCYPQDGGSCACGLAHDTISIGPVVLGKSHAELNRAPSAPVPLQAQAKDFAYVVNMRNLGAKVHSVFLNDFPDGPLDKDPPGLAARMRFAFDSLTTCDYVHYDKVLQFDFKQVGVEEGAPVSQALALTMMATVNVRNSSASSATLILTNTKGDTPRFFNLKTKPCTGGKDCVEILVQNERVPFPKNDPCLKGGIGRDFEFFYRLAASNPTVRVPHGGTTTPPDIAKICDTDLFPKEMDVTTFNRPICPMATFFQ